MNDRTKKGAFLAAHRTDDHSVPEIDPGWPNQRKARSKIKNRSFRGGRVVKRRKPARAGWLQHQSLDCPKVLKTKPADRVRQGKARRKKTRKEGFGELMLLAGQSTKEAKKAKVNQPGTENSRTKKSWVTSKSKSARLF